MRRSRLGIVKFVTIRLLSFMLHNIDCDGVPRVEGVATLYPRTAYNAVRYARIIKICVKATGHSYL